MVNELTTSDEGTCTIEGVQGEITITVTKEGYEDNETLITVNQNTEVAIELLEVDDTNLEDQTRNVKFSVEDSEGGKVSGASISLVNSEDPSITSVSSNGGTGLRGGATVRDVTYGTYNVTVSKASQEATFTLTVGAELSVTGDNVTVESTASSETVVVTLTE